MLVALELVYQFSEYKGKEYSHAFVLLDRKEESEFKAPEQYPEPLVQKAGGEMYTNKGNWWEDHFSP
ncbi:MAG: hypothetical protein ACR2PT_12420 [Endozoicomonas sp.]